jgi:hypothetical protein
MRYVTIESTAYSVSAGREKRFRLTYEIKPLREGLESWFLVAKQEM